MTTTASRSIYSLPWCRDPSAKTDGKASNQSNTVTEKYTQPNEGNLCGINFLQKRKLLNSQLIFKKYLFIYFGCVGSFLWHVGTFAAVYGLSLQHSCLEKSHGRRSLVGCSPWGRKELDTTERLPFHFSLSCIGEGNGNPLQCSCLENPRDGGAWWAAIYGVAQSQTQLK